VPTATAPLHRSSPPDADSRCSAAVHLMLATSSLAQRRSDLVPALRTGLLVRPDGPTLSGDLRTS
jgi:hypothetical protein